MRDTIFAPATPPGPSAIAVVRISGPSAHDVVGSLTGALPRTDRRLYLHLLRHRGEVLDQSLVVCFPREASITGEQYAELHLHGGRAVLSAVVSALSANGVRAARPGEFSWRSLEAGKMGLSQLEGIADLVAAETQSQRRQALRLIEGHAEVEVARLRSLVIQAWGLLEALIDFSDEDLPGGVADGAQEALASLYREIRRAERMASAGLRIRDGFEVVLAGPPNAGKSSLLNAIAGRRVALTSPDPGTTRDMIELRVDLAGLPVTFVDTAGLRFGKDPVEIEGVALARERAAAADLVLRVASVDTSDEFLTIGRELRVWNKADLAPGPGFPVSAETGDGIEGLLLMVGEHLGAMVAEGGVFSRARHLEAIRSASQSLGAAMAAPPEIAVLHLREVTWALDAIVGRIDTEEVLGEIFGRFCIGK